MEHDEYNKFAADAIRAGKCPFGMLKPGQTMGHCPSGFPGCGCADELLSNPYLEDIREMFNQLEQCKEQIKEIYTSND